MGLPMMLIRTLDTEGFGPPLKRSSVSKNVSIVINSLVLAFTPSASVDPRELILVFQGLSASCQLAVSGLPRPHE